MTAEDALVVGRIYRVEWDDCCAAGWFTSELVAIKGGTDVDGSEFATDYQFANGVRLEAKGYGTTFTET